MTSTRVLVIGCGIAGPVLAIFLKRKGYDPILFERLDGVQDAGISLMLQPNGLKVLALVPGLLDRLYSSSVGLPVERLGFYTLVSSPPSTLGSVDDVSSGLVERYGYGMFGVRRTAFHRFLVEAATEEGIEIRWGRQLEGIEEVKGHDGGNDEIVVMFTNGETERGSFVVGCDGLHSGTRVALFGKEIPNYTGLVQVGGYSPTPDVLKEKATMANIFNFKNHMITYPISPTHSSWAISSAEHEAKESWRAIDEKAEKEIKASPWSEWQLGAGKLVRNSEMIVKYGLYDRPQLKMWYKGRVVLLGDAAHPTTPHLGQGANQAFEDVYHLVLALTKSHPSPTLPPTNEQLTAAFSAYQSVRLPRSAELVEGARARGGTRVVPNGEAARMRDDMILQSFSPEHAEGKLQEYDNIGKYPFEGESEVVLV